MSDKTSNTNEGTIPEAFSKNDKGLPEWVFKLRQTLYCKSKQEPKYKFYTLYGLICRPEVIEAAWQMVSRNKGAPGMDGISIKSIKDSAGGKEKFLKEIRKELLAKTYKPDVVKRVYIPKANGKVRPLGIPTVKDRVIQAAVLLVIEPIFEAMFKDCSYGFRPRKSAHQALKKIQEHIRAGNKEAYDVDLASYFDTIPHDKLLLCVQQRITDGEVIKLIRMWLKGVVAESDTKAGVLKYYRPKAGTPQGGVLSPLLANLYLHYFDVLFNKEGGPGNTHGAKLVRYADDFVILAKRIDDRITKFVQETLEGRMGLSINLEKTAVTNLNKKGNNLEFLGYVFRCEKAKQWHGWYHNMLPSPKSLTCIKAKMREETNSRKSFKPVTAVIDTINEQLTGWKQYFSLGFRAPAYSEIDSYVTKRLIKHLKRRSQRAYRCPKDKSWYQHLQDLGYNRISKDLRPCVSRQ